MTSLSVANQPNIPLALRHLTKTPLHLFTLKLPKTVPIPFMTQQINTNRTALKGNKTFTYTQIHSIKWKHNKERETLA